MTPTHTILSCDIQSKHMSNNQITSKLTISISDDNEVLEEIKVTIISPKSINQGHGKSLKCEVKTWSQEEEEGEQFTSLISCVPTCNATTPKALKGTKMSNKLKKQQRTKLPTIPEEEVEDDEEESDTDDDDALDTFVISAFTPVNKITDQYFLGSVLAYKYPDLLHHLQIRHIIALRHNNVQEAKQVCNKLSITLWNFDTRHHQFKGLFSNLMVQIENVISNIPKGERVFIHCRSGQHRSVCVLAALMMKQMNLSLEDAFGHIQYHRPCAELQYAPVLTKSGGYELE